MRRWKDKFKVELASRCARQNAHGINGQQGCCLRLVYVLGCWLSAQLRMSREENASTSEVGNHAKVDACVVSLAARRRCAQIFLALELPRKSHVSARRWPFVSRRLHVASQRRHNSTIMPSHLLVHRHP